MVRPTFSGRETSVSFAFIVGNLCLYHTHVPPANKTQGEVSGNISDTYTNYHAFTVRSQVLDVP